MLTPFEKSIIDLGVLSQRWMTHICNFPSLHSLMVNFTTLMSSGTTRVKSSFRTWEAFLAMAFMATLSLDMLGSHWYSVDAGFNLSGRSYGRCNTRAQCGRDVFLSNHTTLVWNLKGKMMPQTYDVIYQNDQQKVRNTSISHENGVRTTWEKLWLIKKDLRELWNFCYKMGCVKTTLKLVR